MSRPDDLSYVAERLCDALVHDPLIGEHGVKVCVDGQLLLLTGTVATDEHRRAVVDAANRILPDAELRDELSVAEPLAGSGMTGL